MVALAMTAGLGQAIRRNEQQLDEKPYSGQSLWAQRRQVTFAVPYQDSHPKGGTRFLANEPAVAPQPADRRVLKA